jgi:hypothetical protein
MSEEAREAGRLNSAAREATRQTARAQASLSRLENEQNRPFEAAPAALQGMVLPFDYSEDMSQLKAWTELVRAWSVDGLLVPPLKHDTKVWAVAFDPTGERVVTLGNTPGIWDARTGELIGKPRQHTARIWDARTGEPIGKPLQK